MEIAYTQLKNLLLAMHPLSEAELEDFLSVWKPFSANRKEILTAVGAEERYLYF